MFAIEIIIIAALIFLNGYFALSEIALLSVKKSRLRYLAGQGDRRARKALFLVRNSSEMLSTIQIAITAIGIFAGAFSGATMARYFENFLANYHFIAAYSEPISVVLVVMIVTYFSLVIGELVPKQMALSNAEKLSLRVAGTITALMKISSPLVKILSASTKILLKLLRIKPAIKHIVSEEEIKLLIAEGIESGAFEKAELKMVENIFRLGNCPIKDFMTPRKEIVWMNINDSASTIKDKINSSDNTIFPVYEENADPSIGAIETNDILNYLLNNGLDKIDLKSLLQPIMYIDADTPSLAVIDRLRKSSIRIAIIADKKSNKILGIISFHDILEAIVGEFQIKQQ